MTKNILKFCLRGLLADCQRKTLFTFLDAIRKLLAEGIKSCDLQLLEEEINMSLALMERDFPISIQVFVASVIFISTEIYNDLKGNNIAYTSTHC